MVRLKRKDYDLMLDSLDEMKAITLFESCEGDEVLTHIMDIADEFIPKGDDLLKHAEEMKGYMEKYDCDLEYGYFRYYEELLRTNLSAMIYNMICDKLSKVDLEIKKKDISLVEDLIRNTAINIDDDTELEVIDRVVREIRAKFTY